MACNMTGSLMMGLFVGLSLGMAMTAFGMIFMSLLYRKRPRRI